MRVFLASLAQVAFGLNITDLLALHPGTDTVSQLANLCSGFRIFHSLTYFSWSLSVSYPFGFLFMQPYWQVVAFIFTCWPLSRSKQYNMESDRNNEEREDF